VRAEQVYPALAALAQGHQLIELRARMALLAAK
jgi:hypothetical protein